LSDDVGEPLETADVLAGVLAELFEELQFEVECFFLGSENLGFVFLSSSVM